MAQYESIAIIISITFILSLSLSALSIPIINKVGKIFKILDFPDKRKHHKIPLVRIGGLGILIGYLISYYSISFGIKNFYIFNDTEPTTIIIISSFLFFLIGISDDFFKLRPLIKLGLQFIAASYLYAAGINFVGLEFFPFLSSNSVVILPQIFAYLITVFLIVGLTNGFNWLDGLDGLASGISFIVCISLGMIFMSRGQFNLTLISCSLAGSTIGFLRYNIYPARILMGDCGSYLLGGTLSTLSIYGLSQNQHKFLLENNYSENIEILPIYIIFTLFLIPIIDMTQVIILRINDRKSPFFPDRRHLHHKLLSRGINERNSAIILFTCTQISACFALFLFDIKGKVILICLSLIFFFCALLYCFNMKNMIDPYYRKNKN